MSRVEIDNIPIWYEKFGHGPIPVLVIPGAIGTAKSDFEIQFDPNHKDCLDFTKFTFYCVELPGWGRSCPPERGYGAHILHDDAKRLVKLMQTIGHEEFSVYGWSEGSKVAVIMGRQMGPKIKALILQGCVTYASDFNTKRILWSRDIQNWDYEMLKKYEQAYNDLDRVEDLWQRHMDLAIDKYGQFYPQGLLGPPEDGFQKIQCPTLVLHGDRDFFVELKQAETIVRHVPHSRLIRFAESGHNLHQAQSAKFKQIVEKFLIESVSEIKNV